MLYRFENYCLDTRRRELRCGTQLVSAEPQVFDILEYLISNRDRVVSKGDLIRAVWNGRIISESALTTRINGARSAVGDTGREQRLIKTLLRKGVRFVGRVQEDTESTPLVGSPPQPPAQEDATEGAPALPDRPSIAVLSFQNLSGDPQQEYFADGIVEEIIAALSRIRMLFVIARNSSFTYKGRAVDVKQVGRELGVRYVLEGSVRKAAGRVRIAAQLIDASTRAHIWADHFDGTLEHIFDLQDRITRNVIGTIVPKLEDAEIERSKRKPSKNLSAYDYYLRGLAATCKFLSAYDNRGLTAIHRWTKDTNEQALRLLYKSIELDPDFPPAYGMAAMCYAQRKAHGWMADLKEEVAETARLARRAADYGWDDAIALCWGGHALAYVVHDIDTGAAMIDRGLLLNPNLATGWHRRGWVRIWLAEPEAGIESMAYAMRLSPLDPLMFALQSGAAHGHFFAGRAEEASSWATRALVQQPESHESLRISAASNAIAGNIKQARKAVVCLQRIDPTLRVSNLRNVLGPYRPEHLAMYEAGLRKAGLPE